MPAAGAGATAGGVAGAGRLAVLWYIILPRLSNSILVAVSFSILGIFSAFTLPYVLGPAAPEMMGPFMQRTFRELLDPTNAITQAVIAFGFRSRTSLARQRRMRDFNGQANRG